jgi:hypothetical protein
MTAESSVKFSSASSGRTGRIECSFDNDSRLLASLEVFVAHAVGRAGLPEETQRSFAAAAEEACRHMVAAGSGAGPAATTHVLVEEFSDRLEMTIDPPPGSESSGICKYLKGQMSDQIRCELSDGRVRVTMLKAHGAATSGSAS